MFWKKNNPEYLVKFKQDRYQNWIIESLRIPAKSEEELIDSVKRITLIAGFDNEGVRVQYCSEFNIITKYCGTEYGDDTQVTIEGDFE